MPPARKVRASNGRHINVPRVDTIAAFIVTHQWDLPSSELADQAPDYGFGRDAVIGQVSTVRKKYQQLRWFSDGDPAVSRAELLSPERLAYTPKPKSKPVVPAEVAMSKDVDAADEPRLPGRPPTHAVRSLDTRPHDAVTVHTDMPAAPDLRVVPPAFLKLAPPPPPTTPPPRPTTPTPPTTPPAASDAEIQAWLAMGASLLEPMIASEASLRMRSMELADELARVTAEYTDVTSRADALSAYIGVVRAGGSST